VYFGLYQLANRHHELDGFTRPDSARDKAAPGLFAALFAWLRRLLA
jgi:hypothetical protein